MAASGEEIGLEIPEVDRVEQLTPVIDEPDESAVGGGVEIAAVLDADEADVLEQAVGVPGDEDYPTQGG